MAKNSPPVKKTTKPAKPSPKKGVVAAPKPKAAPAKASGPAAKSAKPAPSAKGAPAKPAAKASAPAKAPPPPTKKAPVAKVGEAPAKPKGKGVVATDKKGDSGAKGAVAVSKKPTPAQVAAEAKKVAAAEAAATKAASKAALASAKAAEAAAKKAAAAAAKTAKAANAKTKSGARLHNGSAPQAGQGFLAEPGPRFRSPFSGSASTAKAAAAKMAELAGLTAIRAASVKQGAPVLKKFKKITESPLPEKQLEEFKQLLMEKRDQLVGDVSSMEREALGGDGGSLSRLPQHMADQGTDTYDQSLNLDLAASQRGIVKEIDAALARIANKTFGVCELLGKPIGIDRLRNAPWTRYSIEAARMLELNPELARAGSGGSSSDSEDEDPDDGDDEV